MVPSGNAAGVWAEPLGGARSSAASCSPAERGVRQSGGGSDLGGTRRGLTAVGERKALCMAARVAVEGEQQRGGAQTQRPRRRWESAVEDAEQTAGGGVAQL